ncbi:MAG: ABC transporter substrate-binding protein [Rhodospirillaceae bacterium]|nr:ABC transporter substrate-binding protein [Rhodospirillaceae bacterium]
MSDNSIRFRPVSRRRVLAAGAAGGAVLAAAGTVPRVLRAQPAAIKVGLLHPVTGAISYSGQQARAGALMAIEDINAAGGIASMGGAMLEPVLGDAQSQPEVGAAEVERMNEEGVAAIIGAYASSISLATTQAAARYDLPHIVDVGVSDQIVSRGLANVFRFGPGFGKIADTAITNLVTINEAAGSPARTVMIVHEDSLFGSGLADLLNARLPEHGFEVLDTISHPTPTRDFNNVVLQLKARQPDLIIPANYYNEYVLLARTMLQQRVQPKAVYSVLGGAASSFRFLEEFPGAAQYIMDCNHWYDPSNPKSAELRQRAEGEGLYFTYEFFLDYCCVGLLADALERAGSAERPAIIEALAASTWDGHIMPYGPTEFVDGQNQGARPVNTQILGDDIEVIFPTEVASAEPVFPMPERG